MYVPMYYIKYVHVTMADVTPQSLAGRLKIVPSAELGATGAPIFLPRTCEVCRPYSFVLFLF